jgi:predicted nucleic acid-binding protein
MFRRALLQLRRKGHDLVVSFQNIAEFWCVSTRPSNARGGLGQSVEQTERRVRSIERLYTILPEDNTTYLAWRRLVAENQVHGVKVHDARLAALMLSHSVTHIITANTSDFSRYKGIVAESPSDVLAQTS